MITPLNDDLNIIAALDDEPNDEGGLTPVAFKAKFDEGPNAIKDYINDTLIPELADERAGVTTEITAAVAAAEVQSGNMPTGGTAGQVLVKNSGTNYDYGWGTTVADPVNAGDIVNKGYVDGAADATNCKSLLRDLNIMLNLSLGTTNIDAWADSLADSTRINAATSSNIMVSGGALSAAAISQTTSDNNVPFGYSTTSNQKAAQTFTAIANTVNSISVKLYKTGTPTDNVLCSIYATSSGVPTGSALFTSSTTISGSSLTTTATVQTFSFTGVSLAVGTVYAFVLERSDSLNTTNFYQCVDNGTSAYTGGQHCQYASSAWTGFAGIDLYFIINVSNGTAVWNAVTSTETLSKIAVCPDQTLNTGTITYHVSSDGTNWTQITATNALQSISFSGTSVYLKAAITNDATLNGVAWGGY